ncbi:TadE/TadG family type IV pilus assembly protein [Alcaligenes sp. Marseille-Q7550]
MSTRSAAATDLRPAARQRGVAAIEFALVLSLMLVIFGAIISFSALFLAQQKITHLVGDAARQSVTQALTPVQTAAFFQEYVDRRAQDDVLLHWLGGLSGGFRQAACVQEPANQCGRFSLELSVQPWLLANLLDILSPLLTGDEQSHAPGSLHATAFVVLGRGNQ